MLATRSTKGRKAPFYFTGTGIKGLVGEQLEVDDTATPIDNKSSLRHTKSSLTTRRTLCVNQHHRNLYQLQSSKTLRVTTTTSSSLGTTGIDSRPKRNRWTRSTGRSTIECILSSKPQVSRSKNNHKGTQSPLFSCGNWYQRAFGFPIIHMSTCSLLVPVFVPILKS